MERIMHKPRLLCTLAIALGLACVIGFALFACKTSAKTTGTPDAATMRAREIAEQAGINVEKNPGAVITPQDLRHNTRITAVGLLREVGTGRFPQIAITPPANFDIYLDIDKKRIKNFDDLYNNYVSVTGIVTIDILRFGDIERERYSMKPDAPPSRVQE
jgi:hypothetical protein